jgi:hypothetical protein
MKDIHKIYIIILSCVSIIIIFGYMIKAEEEDQNSISFNQSPIVDIRPINDVINKTKDGSVELFVGNPSSNQFAVQVDFLAIIPSGINLYSDSFQLEDKQGAVIGSFQVMPGQKRDISLKIKSKYVGNFSIQYNMVYHPVGIERDNLKNVILNYIVEEPSTNNLEKGDGTIPAPTANTNNSGSSVQTKNLAFIPIWAMFAILMMVFLCRKRMIKNK